MYINVYMYYLYTYFYFKLLQIFYIKAIKFYFGKYENVFIYLLYFI